MIKRAFLLILILTLISVLLFSCAARNNDTDGSEEDVFDAVYIGVEDYGRADRNTVLDPESCVFIFDTDSGQKTYKIDCGKIFEDDGSDHEDFSDVMSLDQGAYRLHNLLRHGSRYRVTASGDTITGLEKLTEETLYTPVISGTPGERTLKNLIKTAFGPLGHCLYVYGGGWDYQDAGGSYESETIGVQGSWEEFFKENDADYLFKDEEHPEASVFPFGSWNEYHYLGLDCSGYAGWVIYNTMYDEDRSHDSFVKGSSRLADSLDTEYGFGTIVHESNDTEDPETDYSELFDELRTGDVVSVGHHVYIVLGKCSDGSVIIIHSVNNDSVTGHEGGGVELSALNPKGSGNEDCEAFRLADSYTKKYYPEWAERYPMYSKDLDVYLSFPADKETVGIFHWDLGSGSGLKDPDGYADMSAEEILKDIFS